jgi:hypothetical protein
MSISSSERAAELMPNPCCAFLAHLQATTNEQKQASLLREKELKERIMKMRSSKSGPSNT